jgi:hypothetical protein
LDPYLSDAEPQVDPKQKMKNSLKPLQFSGSLMGSVESPDLPVSAFCRLQTAGLHFPLILDIKSNVVLTVRRQGTLKVGISRFVPLLLMD